MGSPRELTLLERVARGEAEAVTALVQRYTPLVWTIARRQLGAQCADDVVQEVFLALWKNAERFDPSLSSETTYVTTVARRRVIDQRRRQGRGPTAEFPEETLAEPDRGLEQVELNEEARVAEAALEELPRRQRDVLRLAIVEGLTHAEISTRTTLPLGTVKSHVRRGLERVRDALARRRAAGLPGLGGRP